MTIRRLATSASALSFSLVAACGASPVNPAGDSASALSPENIILQPIVATPWQSGFTAAGIIAGQDIDGTALYPCRATLAATGLPTPGKTRHDWNWCAVSYGGAVYQETTYATLAPEWIAETKGSVPAGAVPAGTTNGQTLFTCRTTYGGSLVVGQVGAGLAGCQIPYDGIAFTLPSYQVLAIPNAQFGLWQTGIYGGDQVPFNTLQAGMDANGAPIYPCAVSYEGSMFAGQTKPGWGYCQVSYDGLVYPAPGSYSVFLPWIEQANGTTFLAGSDNGGGSLGVCTANYGSSTQVGKYIESSGLCDFPFGTSEISTTQFDVFETKK